MPPPDGWKPLHLYPVRCLCHQTFDGAKFSEGFYTTDGIDSSLIKTDLIISGHIHIEQRWANVYYPGTQDTTPERFLTLEQKALEVDSYAKWRIVDVGQFYVSTRGNVSTAGSLLADRINDGLRDQIGARNLQEVVAGERDQLMLDLRDELNESTAADIGIEVIDVRVKRIDLPDDVRSSVYERMITERNREAQELRSRGEELAIGIRADADRQSIIFRAEAYRDAEQIRGEGDAEATSIYANAYEKDPEFFSFTRSLNAYRSTFNSKGDVLLLDPDSEYFKYLKSENLTPN